VLQNFARKNGIPVDTVAFAFDVVASPLNAIPEAPAVGVYVHGLFMEGGRWDAEKNTLAECHPREMYSVRKLQHISL
jgi:dynein heavy chain